MPIVELFTLPTINILRDELIMTSHLLYHILFPPGLLFPSASQLPLFIVLLHLWVSNKY